MANPPAYSDCDTARQPSNHSSRQEPVPPYRASHGFANSQEELAALKEFAESKLYVTPGTDGTLSGIRGGLSWSGPVTPNSSKLEAERRELADTRRRLKEEQKVRKMERKMSGAGQAGERERKGSVGERLKRVFSGGNGGIVGLGGDGKKDVVR